VVEDNGYVIIGGLMRNFKETRERKIPGLHRIPFLGHLFKTTSTSLDRRNLMIIVEAQIITPGGRTYYKEPEPDDVGPREGSSYRSPGQTSELNHPRPNSVQTALGQAPRAPMIRPEPVERKEAKESEPLRRTRPVPLPTDPARAVTDVIEANKAPAPAGQAMTPHERMERLARATRANPVSLNSSGPGWSMPEEESEPKNKEARGEVINTPNE
jgi:hypothetical protein